MSISRNILLCTVCQDLFHDARQLRCGHSFCYQCILTNYDRLTDKIVCPRCQRIHSYESFQDFQMTLIVDAFVMSLVIEHERKTRMISKPLVLFTFDEILRRSPKPFLIAKCAECFIRKELVVCPECEQVICFDCISQHQLIVNNRVQESFRLCKETWNQISEKSMLFDERQFDLKSYFYHLKTRIINRSNFLLDLIEKSRDIYLQKTLHYSQILETISRDIIDQYQILEQQIQLYLNSHTPDPIQNQLFSKEINQLTKLFNHRNKQLNEYIEQSPKYSCSPLDYSLLGKISFGTSIEPINDDENYEDISANIEYDNQSIASDESEQTIKETELIPTKQIQFDNIPNKKLLWTLYFKFVPQYISLYRQSILFASDRWGFVSTWTYTNARTKPTPKKTFVLFPQFRVGNWSRVYVESFSVYKPYICVFVKGSDESLGNFIAFFTHTGQIQMKIEYEHRYTLRQLICDETPKGNCIWTVDRGMHCIYKHDLPRTIKEIKPFLSTHKSETRLNDRSFDVIRMAVNQHLLALLDSRTQIVTLYDKTTQKEIGIYSINDLPTGDNKLWRVEIFPDNSLLLRFDDNERTGDRSQIIHHIVVHVKKNESNSKYEAISQIQATNVYGFAIGSDSEVVIGLRKSNCFEGLISCYI